MFPEHSLTLFKAYSAAEITGRSLDNQRNDVRAGAVYDSTISSGHRIFDVYGLAEMMIVQALTDWRVRPTDSIEIARRVAPLVAFWALTRPGAMRGDLTAYHAACEAEGIAPGRRFEANDGTVQDVTKFAVLFPDGVEGYTDTLDSGGRDPAPASGLPVAPIIINIHEFGETLFLRARQSLGWI